MIPEQSNTLQSLLTFRTHWRYYCTSPINGSFESRICTYAKRIKYGDHIVDAIVIPKREVPLCCEFRIKIVHHVETITVSNHIVHGHSVFSAFKETTNTNHHNIVFVLEFPSTKSIKDPRFQCVPLIKCFGVQDGILHAAFVDISSLVAMCRTILAIENTYKNRYVFRFRVFSQDFQWQNIAIPFAKDQKGKWVLTTKGFSLKELAEIRVYSDFSVTELKEMQSNTSEKKYDYGYCMAPHND
jgi:hypothetical protein